MFIERSQPLKRALVCAPLLPEFDREGGSRRIYHFIQFLRDEGWGTVATEPLAEGILAVDTTDWSEALARATDQPSCHFTCGMFSDFFTRLGGYPAAVMEVECRSRGDARCRFLVGSPDMLTWLYEGMVEGEGYEQLARQIGPPR